MEYFVGEREHLFLKKGLHHWGLPKTLPGTAWYWVHFISVPDGRIRYKNHPPLPTGKQAGKADTIPGRVMAFLMQHADRDFESKLLSEQLNLNYSYVSAAFKKLTGQSVIEAHSKLRMNKAIKLMRTSSMNVSEISEQLGYQNPYYFSRVFKKILGESPSSYMNHMY